jgi:zinc transport system substrate-binding protein
MVVLRNVIDNTKRIVPFLLLISTAAFALMVPFAGCVESGRGEKMLRVAADIVPLADFCREIGGELVEVESLVPPGASPHAYELTTGQMRFLAGADVLVTNGLELTPWAEDVFSKAGNPDVVAVVAGEAVPYGELMIIPGHDGGTGEHDDHGVYDPHVWLDPNLAVYMVEAVRDGFIQADAENARSYAENADRYIEELLRLDGEIREEVETFSRREFVAFHSSWIYFARRYGLEQAGVIEEQPGKEPSAGEIARLFDMVKARGVRAIFAEPQFSPRAAVAIAEETGGEVAVSILDPLGDPEDPERNTYLKMMKSNLGVMGEALR